MSGVHLLALVSSMKQVVVQLILGVEGDCRCYSFSAWFFVIPQPQSVRWGVVVASCS